MWNASPGQAVAADFGVDLRAASLGVLVFFQHQHARPLAHHETVPIRVPWAGGTRRRIIERGRQRARGAEAGNAQFANAGFRAAGDHHVGIAPHDQPRRIADRVHAGGAGGHHRVVWALEAVFDREMAGGEVDQRRRDEERRQAPGLSLEHLRRRFEDRLQAADAGADHHAGGAAILLRIGLPAGILDRLGGGDQGEMDEPVHLLLVLNRDPFGDVEPPVGLAAMRDLARDLAGQVLHIEGLNRGDARFAVDQPLPYMRHADAEWTGDAHARHHHAPRSGARCHLVQLRLPSASRCSRSRL